MEEIDTFSESRYVRQVILVLCSVSRQVEGVDVVAILDGREAEEGAPENSDLGVGYVVSIIIKEDELAPVLVMFDGCRPIRFPFEFAHTCPGALLGRLT